MGRVNKKAPAAKLKAPAASMRSKGSHSKTIAKKKSEVNITTLAPSPAAGGTGRWAKQMRREIKRQGLVASLEEEASRRREAEAAKRRRKRPVIGDLDPLAQSLDEIGVELERKQEEDRRKKGSPTKKQKGTAKEKKRKADFLQRVQAMKDMMAQSE